MSALNPTTTQLTGNGTLLRRTSPGLGSVIEQLGGTFKSANGQLPYKISGPIGAGKSELDGSQGSQVLSGLLYALPMLNGGSEIHVRNLASKPYIDMTIDILGKFGIEIINNNYELFQIKGNQFYKSTDYTIEGDWSGASFLLSAAAICGQVSVCELNPDSIQADKKILNVLEMVGANAVLAGDTVSISHNNLTSFEFDARDCPDLIPAILPLACNCKGRSIISGLGRLKNKESDRADVLFKEFTKLGADLRIDNDSMIIHGKELSGAITDSHGDHRIAMSLAISGLNARSDLTINSSGCVAKSYPSFFRDLEHLTENK